MFPPVDLNSTKKCFIRTHLARIDTSFKQSELIRNCVNFQDIVLWPIKMFEYQISYLRYLPHLDFMLHRIISKPSWQFGPWPQVLQIRTHNHIDLICDKVKLFH